MGNYSNTDDIVDAQGVADLLGRDRRNAVSSYQKWYPGMPRPVVGRGQGRCKLWRRTEIKKWRDRRQAAVVGDGNR